MGKSVHDFTETTIDGKKRSLADYAGKVLLIVNVASECGYTGQYTGLEDLQKKYGAKGLRVLGFPANDFGAQEPGSNEEIQTFCTSKFGVTFDMFAKIAVKGEGTDPLFAFLQSDQENPGFGGPIKWNFGKFLVGKDGRVVARFGHKDEPTGQAVTGAIEKALGG
jgi:glutathione peroxidase